MAKLRKALKKALDKNKPVREAYRSSLQNTAFQVVIMGLLGAAITTTMALWAGLSEGQSAPILFSSIFAASSVILFLFVVKPETDFVFYNILVETGEIPVEMAREIEKEMRLKTVKNPLSLLIGFFSRV